jgi:hypothetical protein
VGHNLLIASLSGRLASYRLLWLLSYDLYYGVWPIANSTSRHYHHQLRMRSTTDTVERPIDLRTTPTTLFSTVMPATNPWLDYKYKINTRLVEYSARNNAIDAFYFWLFLRAVDIERHHNATGKLYGITDVCKRVAFKTRRSMKTIRRYLRKAEIHSFVFIDYDNDLIEIRSRAKATLLQRNSETNCGGEDGVAPDAHADRVGDIMEVTVTIPEIWDVGSIGLSHARLLSITRQRLTERGWGRDSLAKLTGMSRRSTSRADAARSLRRGYQFAFVPVSSIVKGKAEELEEIGKQIEASYHRKWECTEGNGKKLWLGHYDGKPVVYTQLSVKWDTPFRGRLRPDRDVIAKVMSSGVPALMDECRSLHPVFAEHGRDSDASRGENVVGDAARQSIWRAIRAACTGLGLRFNPQPMIVIKDAATWSIRSFGTPESSNQDTTKALKRTLTRVEEKAHRTLEAC